MKPAGGVRRERLGEIRHNMPAEAAAVVSSRLARAARDKALPWPLWTDCCGKVPA